MNNHLFKFSQEMTVCENSPLLIGIKNNSIQKKIILSAAEYENSSHKEKNSSYDYQFSNILSSIKNTFDSTQESDFIPERSSLNFISEYDHSDMISGDELSQNEQQKYSLDEYAMLKLQENILQNDRMLCHGDQQILQKTNNTDIIYFNDIEEKIFKWLDTQGVKHVSPQDKMDEFYEQKKRIISSQIISLNKSQNENIEEDKKPACKFRKQSLLERRKQQNKKNPAFSPSSCINLGQVLTKIMSDFKDVSSIYSTIEVDQFQSLVINGQEL